MTPYEAYEADTRQLEQVWRVTRWIREGQMQATVGAYKGMLELIEALKNRMEGVNNE